MVRILALVFVLPASASLLSTKSKCGPQTKVSYSDAKDAASVPIFSPVALTDGVCFPVAKESTVVKFCGPGTLTLSRMTCDQHQYKALTFEHAATEWTSGCEDIPAVGAVDGWLGSAKVTC